MTKSPFLKTLNETYQARASGPASYSRAVAEPSRGSPVGGISGPSKEAEKQERIRQNAALLTAQAAQEVQRLREARAKRESAKRTDKELWSEKLSKTLGKPQSISVLSVCLISFFSEQALMILASETTKVSEVGLGLKHRRI